MKRTSKALALAHVVHAITGRNTVDGFHAWFDEMVTKRAQAAKELAADRDKWQLTAVGRAIVAIQERDKLKVALETVRDGVCVGPCACCIIDSGIARDALDQLETT